MKTGKHYTLTGDDVYLCERLITPFRGLFLKNVNLSKSWQGEAVTKDGEKYTILRGHTTGYKVEGDEATAIGFDISGSRATIVPCPEDTRQVDEFRECEVKVVKVDLNEFSGGTE
jgi:hypothetical protein